MTRSCARALCPPLSASFVCRPLSFVSLVVKFCIHLCLHLRLPPSLLIVSHTMNTHTHTCATGGHLDDVEDDQQTPIVSISLGCAAVFLGDLLTSPSSWIPSSWILPFLFPPIDLLSSPSASTVTQSLKRRVAATLCVQQWGGGPRARRRRLCCCGLATS